jgi:hypothetical protein
MKIHTITLNIEDAADFGRVMRVIAHLFHPDSNEWDGPTPKVGVVYGEKGDVSDL